MDVSDKNCEGPDNPPRGEGKEKKKKKEKRKDECVATENLGESRLKRCTAQTA